MQALRLQTHSTNLRRIRSHMRFRTYIGRPTKTPNNTLNRSAQKLRFWVPAPLRVAAPG